MFAYKFPNRKSNTEILIYNFSIRAQDERKKKLNIQVSQEEGKDTMEILLNFFKMKW